MAETNSQGLRGVGGPAADSIAKASALNNPVNRFQDLSAKNRFLYTQASTDCYFMIVSAFAYYAQTGERGGLVWRTSMTASASRVTQWQAYLMMISAAGPFYGSELDEAETIRIKAKDFPSKRPTAPS